MLGPGDGFNDGGVCSDLMTMAQEALMNSMIEQSGFARSRNSAQAHQSLQRNIKINFA